MDQVEKIAAAVLYEGYVLWPYRRSAIKNQQRWTFGGVYPRAYSEATGANDPWLMQTQCLIIGRVPVVEVRVRFLHVVERLVGRQKPDGAIEFVDELQVGDERYLAWEEAIEREVSIKDLKLPELGTSKRVKIDIAAGSEEESLYTHGGEVAGVCVRSWHSLEGEVEVSATRVCDDLFELTVRITNSAPWSGQDRQSTLRQTFISTHTMLEVSDGEFVSLMDPPGELRDIAGRCENIRTWPVLAGEEGDKHLVLSSPIILYDYPRIAPESPGDLFDGTEIDQLLTLNILTLTDEERAEMRASDPRTREILERAESLTSKDLMNLHGAIREFQVIRGGQETFPIFEESERPAPKSVVVNGVAISNGSKVRLRPRPGGDIMDIALAGKVAFVEMIEQDYEDKIHLAVTLEDDPGRDLGQERQIGHRFFFGLEEVEPIIGAES